MPQLSELTLHQETAVLQVGCSQKVDLRKVQKWFNPIDKLGHSISSGRRVGVGEGVVKRKGGTSNFLYLSKPEVPILLVNVKMQRWEEHGFFSSIHENIITGIFCNIR